MARPELWKRREISVGTVEGVAILAVIHIDREGRVRIISAGRLPGGTGGSMSRKHDRPMTIAEIASMRDEDIDFSDIPPELDETFWAQATRVEPDRTEPVTLRVKTSVLEAFRTSGKGYRTRMIPASLAAAMRLRSRAARCRSPPS